MHCRSPRALASVAFLTLACGSRSGLPEVSGEPCPEPDATRACYSVCGQGLETCTGGYWKGCTAPRPKDAILTGRLRDFHSSHPDMESALGDDPGIVAVDLGPDGKPVYAGNPTTATTHGKAAFDQWFRDAPGTNLGVPFVLPLERGGGSEFYYADSSFFPLDDQLFGNEGNPHNYHFTLEVESQFRFQGGESFTFNGDDDVFVFINRRLAIDLGGVHGSESQTVSLEESAPYLGIAAGNVYSLHLFYAERHTSGSTFRLETSIEEFDLCK